MAVDPHPPDPRRGTTGPPAEVGPVVLRSASRLKHRLQRSENDLSRSSPVLTIVRQPNPDRDVLTDIALRAHGFGRLLDSLVSHPDMLSNPHLLDEVIVAAEQIVARTRKAVAA